MKNTTNQKFKKHLIDFEEFAKSRAESSNYEAPIAAVIPPPNDKIWNFVKKEMDSAPKWGVDLKGQEKRNQTAGVRDGEPGDEPLDSAKI